MTKALTWRAASASRLHWRSWDDEFVVYHSGWGTTHLLDLVAAEALRILDRESASLPELAELVARSLKIQPDDELFCYLEELLPELEKLGLIEWIPA